MDPRVATLSPVLHHKIKTFMRLHDEPATIKPPCTEYHGPYFGRDDGKAITDEEPDKQRGVVASKSFPTPLNDLESTAAAEAEAARREMIRARNEAELRKGLFYDSDDDSDDNNEDNVMMTDADPDDGTMSDSEKKPAAVPRPVKTEPSDEAYGLLGTTTAEKSANNLIKTLEAVVSAPEEPPRLISSEVEEDASSDEEIKTTLQQNKERKLAAHYARAFTSKSPAPARKRDSSDGLFDDSSDDDKPAQTYCTQEDFFGVTSSEEEDDEVKEEPRIAPAFLRTKRSLLQAASHLGSATPTMSQWMIQRASSPLLLPLIPLLPMTSTLIAPFLVVASILAPTFPPASLPSNLNSPPISGTHTTRSKAMLNSNRSYGFKHSALFLHLKLPMPMPPKQLLLSLPTRRSVLPPTQRTTLPPSPNQTM